MGYMVESCDTEMKSCDSVVKLWSFKEGILLVMSVTIDKQLPLLNVSVC